jgi:hypothetical protein
MSFSMIEPDEPMDCECRYDEIRDRMDRDDCPFHCDLPEDDEVRPTQRKPATRVRKENEAA